MAYTVRLFNANETNFDHYETVLDKALALPVEEDENGLFSCELIHTLDERIEEGKIITALTPRGEQYFRIIKIKKALSYGKNYISAYCRHITYDLLNNFIENIRPTDTTLQSALQVILNGTMYPHPFTASSDVTGINTANYVRMNPIAAIMGQNDNSALNRWGGYLIRDKFNFRVLATSPDRGYTVEIGKNLLGIEEEIDLTDVVTRLIPTVVIQDNVVTHLPEKYIDSPLISSYPHPIIKEYPIELTEEEKELPTESIYTLMRTRAQEQYTLGVDKPKVNYGVDFVQLRKTEQYKHLSILETLDISDTVGVYVPLIGVDVLSRMIKYKYDGLAGRYERMELGNFKPRLTNQRADLVKLIEDTAKNLTDGVITSKLKDAIDLIVGNRGGTVLTMRNDIGEPIAHAYLDTNDVSTAQNYILINSEGIAFGDQGLSGQPTLAIGIDGEVVGESAFFRSLVTNLIQSEFGSSLDLESNVSVNTKVSNAVISAVSGGGRNLILGSSKEFRNSLLGQFTGKISPEVSTIYFADYGLKVGDTLTFNIYLDCATNTLKGCRARISPYRPDDSYSFVSGNIIEKGKKGYSKVSYTIGEGFDRVQLLLQNPDTTIITGENVAYKEAKLEKGSIATGWTPAPEDLETRMASAEQKITADAITSTVTESTTYQADLNGKEGAITKSNTAPASSPGRLWLDTSVTPNVLKRSNGIGWVKASPTEAAEVGAYSAGDGAALAGRINTAEQKITPTAIKQTVEEQIQVNGSTILATKGDITLTKEEWTAIFSDIGGANLYPDSENLKGKFSTIAGSVITTQQEGISVPEWGATNATRVVTSTAGTSEIKAYLPLSSDYPFLSGKTITMSVYIKNNRSGLPLLVRANRFSSTITLQPLEAKRIIITGSSTENGQLQVQLRAPSASGYIDATIWHPKFELGPVASDWNQKPDEFMSGITKINRYGVTVGVSNSDINTNVAFDGLRVFDFETEIASFGAYGSKIGDLQADTIRADVQNTLDMTGNLVLQVGAGKAFGTISEALESLGKSKYLRGGYYIRFEVYGSISDFATIEGWSGSGNLIVYFTPGAKLYGGILSSGNSCNIQIRGTTGGQGTIKRTVNSHPIQSVGDFFLWAEYLNINGSGDSSGILFQQGSRGIVGNCDIANAVYGIRAEYGCQVGCYNNRGNVTDWGYRCTYGSLMNIFGTMPKGTTYGLLSTYQANIVTQGTITGADSTFTTPPTTPTVFSSVFKPAKIYTKNHGSSSISTYYGATAAQGKYTGMEHYEDGYFDFGRNVYDYHQGGTNVSIQLRLHRKNSTHGPSAGVEPDPDNFTPTGSFSSVTRGAWGNWVTVPTALFTATGAILRFYSSLLDAGYAIWDDAEVKVTVTKDV